MNGKLSAAIMSGTSTLQDFLSAVAYCITVIIAVLMIAGFSPKRKRYAVRLSLSIFVIFAVYLAFTAYFSFTPYYEIDIFLQSLKFLTVFVLSGVMGYCCFAISAWEAVFFAVAGYCMQHIGARVWDLIALAVPSLPYGWGLALNLLLSAGIYAAFYFGYIRRKLANMRPRIHRRMQLVASLFVVAVSIVYNTFGISYANSAIIIFDMNGIDSMAGIGSLVYVYLSTSIIAFIAFLLSFSSNYLQSMTEENELLDFILEERRKQYEEESESVRALNTRLHDIKHFISAIGTEDEKQEVLKEINTCDAEFKTGNDALDTLFTSKYLLCMQKQIRFNCMIDGKRLGFIPKFELYSLFANAIDNAIDCVQDLPPEKRIISVSQTAAEKEFAVIFENFFEREIKFSGGLPQTDKDKRMHGLGIKSMKSIAEKYGGTLSAETYDDVFSLKLVFPQ
ncbi:MAG: sensor histidine kinase [Clostridiales bacterium]|nr:sensor histidine kinase [Clostridiales bacterium]